MVVPTPIPSIPAVTSADNPNCRSEPIVEDDSVLFLYV